MPNCTQVLRLMTIKVISTREKNFRTRNQERKFPAAFKFVRDRFPTNHLNRNKDFSTITTRMLTAFWLKRRRSLWRRLSVSPLSSLALQRPILPLVPHQLPVVASEGSSKMCRKRRNSLLIPRKHHNSKCQCYFSTLLKLWWISIEYDIFTEWCKLLHFPLLIVSEKVANYRSMITTSFHRRIYSLLLTTFQDRYRRRKCWEQNDFSDILWNQLQLPPIRFCRQLWRKQSPSVLLVRFPAFHPAGLLAKEKKWMNY